MKKSKYFCIVLLLTLSYFAYSKEKISLLKDNKLKNTINNILDVQIGDDTNS